MVTAKWLGMKMKKVLKATEPAAISAKPRSSAVALSSPKSWDRPPNHLPGLLDREELTRLADSPPYNHPDQSQGQRQNERQPPPAGLRGI